MYLLVIETPAQFFNVIKEVVIFTVEYYGTRKYNY